MPKRCIPFMIKVDISNVWGSVEFADLMQIEHDVAAAHAALADGSGAGSEYLGWMDLPGQEPGLQIDRILAAAGRIRQDSEILVVVGAGGSCLGARAGIEFLQGENRNLTRSQGDPQILFTGSSLSTRQWNELRQMLDGKDFSLAIVSKSGSTVEPAIAARALRWMLERKYGTDCARRRIYAVTDPVGGALRAMAQEEGWESFNFPGNVCGRFGVLCAAGLLPMAAAGVDIRRVLAGAQEAREAYALRSYENPVWLYAAVRNLMLRRGKTMELLCYPEPGLRPFGRWWQQLFAESEGKQGRGLFPVGVEFPADLHCLGQMIQQGQRNLFETVLRFAPPQQHCTIDSDVKNLDQLNYLAGKHLDYVDEIAFQSALSAHVDGGVPVVSMECGEMSEETLGDLFYFMELSCAISAYILGVNPFDQSGIEPYNAKLMQLLGKPGYEKL